MPNKWTRRIAFTVTLQKASGKAFLTKEIAN